MSVLGVGAGGVAGKHGGVRQGCETGRLQPAAVRVEEGGLTAPGPVVTAGQRRALSSAAFPRSEHNE